MNELSMTPLTARLWDRNISYAWSDVDITETDDEYIFNFEIPEALKNNVKIWVENNKLTVSGTRAKSLDEAKDSRSENACDKFHRSFRLPRSIDKDKVDAGFVDSTLIIVLPKISEARKTSVNINPN
jgi:HSP20 family protein